MNFGNHLVIDVLRILSTSKKYKIAKRWWIYQFTKAQL